MLRAYSRLKDVLLQQHLSVPELHRRIQRQGLRINVKSLYRLSNAEQPVERLDLRVAGIICQVCQVPLSELITFERSRQRLRRLSAANQKRLDTLMTKNNEGILTAAERGELKELVREAETLTLENARALARQRRHLATK